MKLHAAIKKAAHYRTDVRRFEIDDKGDWFVTFYWNVDGIKNKLSWLDFETLNEGDTLEQVLEDILGPEPQIRGQRDETWFMARHRFMDSYVSEYEQ